MEKSAFEQMGGTYRQEEDFFLPNLILLESISVGIWGQRRRQYLREYRKALCNALLLSGKLDSHLADINRQAEDMCSQLVEQMEMQEGISEQLKVDNQIEWMGRMNNIGNIAWKMIQNELIYI